jgi:hypothetical protein
MSMQHERSALPALFHQRYVFDLPQPKANTNACCSLTMSLIYPICVCVGKSTAKVQCKGAMPVASGSDGNLWHGPLNPFPLGLRRKYIRMVCAGWRRIGRRKFISPIAATQLHRRRHHIHKFFTGDLVIFLTKLHKINCFYSLH